MSPDSLNRSVFQNSGDLNIEAIQYIFVKLRMNISDWTGELIYSCFKIHWDIIKEKNKIHTSHLFYINNFPFMERLTVGRAYSLHLFSSCHCVFCVCVFFSFILSISVFFIKSLIITFPGILGTFIQSSQILSSSRH